MESSSRIVVVVVVIAAGVLGVLLWRHRAAPVLPKVPVVQPLARPSVAAAPVAKPAARPAILHPIAPPETPSKNGLPEPDAADAYLKNALLDLLGRKAVASFFNLDGIARRFVATVNNLATDNASASLWPVRPTEGRLLVDARGNTDVISPANGDRYVPFVRLAETIDIERAVALYRRLYPMWQRAYEDIGESGKYFNDRLVEVIDDLLATPNLAGPIRIKRITVDGMPPSAQGRELYVFDDPTLEHRSAGQKILLRMGTENAKRVKVKLAEIRQLIATGPRP